MGERLSFDTPDELKAAAVARMRQLDGGTILEVGPYVRPQVFIRCGHFIFVDAHRPYLEHVKIALHQLEAQHQVSIPATYLHGTADQVLPLMLNKSVDTFYAGDVIEHMDREAGQRMIKQAIRLARQQVILFTPLGFIPQHYRPGFIDFHGHEDCEWQAHVSGWTPDDFGREWDILVCEKYHTDGWNRPEREAEIYGAFFAIYTAI